MNTSQWTPRTRAAYASAWPWLPAEPVTTPPLQPSPSAASLDSAPRSLNDPVRWRFSALRATVAPHSSEIVREERTGVRRTTSATAARARSTSGVGHCHDRIDLHLGALGQAGHADRNARRGVGLEVLLVDLVHRAEGG